MKRVAEYRRYAAVCLKLAQRALSDADRATLVEMAANWHALAATREKSVDERNRREGNQVQQGEAF
jgi:hypothetical protein